MTETHRVRDLAAMICELTDGTITNLPNPRAEADENELVVNNDQFLELGLDPIRLQEGLLDELLHVARKYQHRIDLGRIPSKSAWNRTQAAGLNRVSSVDASAQTDASAQPGGSVEVEMPAPPSADSSQRASGDR